MIISLADMCCPYCNHPPLSVDESGTVYHNPDGPDEPCAHLFAYVARRTHLGDLDPCGELSAHWTHPALSLSGAGLDCWEEAISYADQVPAELSGRRLTQVVNFMDDGSSITDDERGAPITIWVDAIFVHNATQYAEAVEAYCRKAHAEDAA